VDERSRYSSIPDVGARDAGTRVARIGDETGDLGRLGTDREEAAS
jgi:hypothetical protein